MGECKTHNETFRGVENMSNSSKHLLNRKDVTEGKLQNLIVNDGSRQSINPIQNQIQMKGICTLMNTDYKLLVKVSMFKP
jgi:hypothetical protein